MKDMGRWVWVSGLLLLGAVRMGELTVPTAVSIGVPRVESGHWVRGEIGALLRNDPHLDYRGVKVNTANGATVLTGYVLTDFEKAHAAQVAGNIPDIKAVKNEIMVVQYTAGRGGAVARRVRSQIIQDPAMDVTALDVEAEKNGVILHGIVPMADLKERIGRFVLEVNGVQRVENDLDVEPVQ
jgi:osmotically-inducible protein OsmY